MTEQRLAKILIEGADQSLNKKVSVFLNRLLLRIFSVPALMNALVDTRSLPDAEAGEGAVKLQFDFMRLPEEVLPELERLLAAPGKVKYMRYVKDNEARTGVELTVKPDELGGSDYDYAF